MDDAEIDRFIDQVVPEDAKGRFRERQTNPPAQGNAPETSIDDLDEWREFVEGW